MAFLIKRIEQKDDYTFILEWSDGKEMAYRLSLLQQNCPCAGCVDEKTGNRVTDPLLVDKNVKAVKITSVGRYGIRIYFTSGCSNGIYSFDFLRDIGLQT